MENSIYEPALQHLLCPTEQLDKDLKREIDIKRNVIRIVSNMGDQLMKLCFIENNNYAIIYLRNLRGLSLVQFNICNLIAPTLGTLLKFDRHRNLVPANPDIFVKECSVLYQIITEQFDIVRMPVALEDIKKGELCLNIILGSADDFNNMQKVVPMLESLLHIVYTLAREVFHATGTPEKARIEARKYMRAFNKYQNE